MFLLPNKYTQLTRSPLTPVKRFAKGGPWKFWFWKTPSKRPKIRFSHLQGKPPANLPKIASYDVQKQPILAWQVNKKKVWFIQTITQLFLFGTSQNFIGFVWLLTLDNFCWGYGRWAGKGSVQRSWHERKKPCTMIKGASWTRDVLRVDRSDSPTSDDRQAGMSSCAVFCHGEASMINGRR